MYVDILYFKIFKIVRNKGINIIFFFLKLIQQTGGLTKILSYCQESDDPEASNVNAAAAKALARSARKCKTYFYLI